MDQSALGLQAPPQTASPDSIPLPVPPQCDPGYELLIELLICVMHRELRQESHDE